MVGTIDMSIECLESLIKLLGRLRQRPAAERDLQEFPRAEPVRVIPLAVVRFKEEGVVVGRARQFYIVVVGR